MTRRLPFLTLLGLLLAGVGALAGGADLVALQRPESASGVVVVPDHFLRSWDPITVFFPRGRGPDGGGPEDAPDRFVTLSPGHPGAWAWLDDRTLQFRPAEPWPALSLFSVGADGRGVDLYTLLAPPVETAPRDGARGLGPVDTVVLTFARPLPPEALARMAAVELRPLPGLGDSEVRRLTADDFEVKVLDRLSPDDPARYALVLDRPIPLGVQATVTLGLALDDGDQPASRFTFETAEPFRVASVGCRGVSVPVAPGGTAFAADSPFACSPGSRELWLDLTARPAAIGPVEAKNLVRLDPAVDDLTFETSGRRLVVRGRFLPQTAYTVTVAPTPLRDVDGRTLDLDGPSSVVLTFPRRDPYLSWADSDGLLELRGPRVLPLTGRGHGRLDVRLVRVDPVDRSYWPFPDDPVSVDEDERPPHPGEEPEPWTSTRSISSGELQRRLVDLRTTGVSRIVELPVDPDGDAARFGLDLDPLLDDLGGDAGHYLVGIRKLDGGDRRSWQRVQITDLSLTTVETGDQVRFVVRSLASGAPVGGAAVRVEGERRVPGEDAERIVLFEGRTDGSGAIDWSAPGYRGRTIVRVDRIVVSRGDDVLVLDPADAPDAFADGLWRDGRERWLQWAFEDLEHRVEQPVRLAHLFPERPIYRPGETVHLRGYVRERNAGRLEAVRGAGHVEVRGPGGETYRLPVELTGAGALYTTFDEEQPSAGLWTATFDDGHGRSLGEATFRIEAYRLPTFEVSLDGAPVVGNDRPFEVKLAAGYYAGGKVADEAVRWRVTQYPYAWEPAALPGFVWSSDGRFGRWQRFESTPALDRETRTDDAGSATLALDPGVEPTAQPRTYVVEATVTGADAQTVTAVERFHAVPAFALGLQVDRWLETAEVIRPRIAVVGPDGEPLAGQEVTVRLLERQWHSHLQASDFSDGVARYVTDVSDVPVRETTVTSGAEPVSVDLPIDRSGVWIVELEARDRLGRAQTVRVDLYAGGRDAVAWEKPTAGTFELTVDESSHRPGETAKVLIRSPFQTAEALVVVEAPDGNRYHHVAVRGGQATFRLPIEEGWVPRLPVHVVLQRGRGRGEPAPGATVDPSRPQTVASTVELAIEPVENTVAVGITAPDKAMPGQTVPVTLKLSDPDGRPLSGEATLWLVDRAVLALGREARLDPVPDFVPPRRSRVAIRDTRNLVLGRVPVSPMPGGDGEEEADEGDAMDQITVRRNLKPVPYYRAGIPVGPSGEVTVEVALPDNLTTFAIRAKATSGTSRFGAGKDQIAVRLPVVVQPALPRFVRPGDRFDAAAVARVVEGPHGSARAEIRAEGLTVDGSGEARLTLGAKAATVGFPVTVQTPPLDDAGRLARDGVIVRIAARREADGAGDAFEVVLPLADDREEVVRRSLVPVDGTVTVPALDLPARPGSVHRRIVVSDRPGMLKLLAALDVLRRAPRHGTGTRLDAARGWLAVAAFREGLALGDTVSAEADEAVADALRWLPDVVDGRGLVADWPGARGSVHRTADAVLFLVEAKAAGRRVDEALLASLLGTLERSLRSDWAVFVDGESWYERTRSLHALAAAGSLDEAYWSELLRNSGSLGIDGASRVVLAAARVGEVDRTGVSGLVDRLEGEVTTRLVDGEEVYGGLRSRGTDRNPLILPSEARTLGELARAVAAVRPSSERLALVIDALVSIGGEDGWGSTDADREALLALAADLAARPSAKRTVRFTVGGRTETAQLGGERAVAVWEGDAEGPVEVSVDGAASLLAIERSIPRASGSEVAAAANGYVVERTLLKVRDGGPPDTLAVEAGGAIGLAIGDVVEDHVRVVVPETRHYVAVTVPLAAGLEPLNPALATAGPDATPSAGPTRAPTATVWSDHAVTHYYDVLPKGTWDLRFRARATTAGRFVQPAAAAVSIYDRSVRGNSAGTAVEVAP